MKKLVLAIALIFSLSLVCTKLQAEGRNQEYKYENRSYRKGNIAIDDLPSNTIKYLDKNYPDYFIMVAKRKGNGYYFVKIRFNNDNRRPYYRSLVFDTKGNVVKG